MFTYKKAPYKIFALGPKFCWAGPASNTRIYITGRNPMGVTPRCYEEVSNPKSHRYHEALKTTKPILWDYLLYNS